MFFLKNKILFGDSCSGKTFFFKKININKIDIDFLIEYKKIYLKYEFFFRKIEKSFLFFLSKINNNFLIIGGGGVNLNLIKEFLIYKNNSIINQKKKLIFDNFNRPTLKNNNYLKIRFCIRKKMYLKISDYYLNNCINCNLILL